MRVVESELDRLRRKEDQAWELAGCARVDGDRVDEKKWTEEARRLQDKIGGHPDSQQLANEAEDKLKQLNKDARCTYFPMEGRWQVWLNNKPISDWSLSYLTALTSAIQKLGVE